MERLTRFQATNLFGYLNQDVSLATEHGITILHGANGSGKTTLLKCLAEVSQGDWQGLSEKPLERLTLHFESSNKFECTKAPGETAVTFEYSRKGKKPLTWTITNQALEYLQRFPMEGRFHYVDEENYRITRRMRAGVERIRYKTIPRDAWEILRMTTGREADIEPPPDWLIDFEKTFRCTLIEEQRLIRIERDAERSPKLTRVVSEFSASITDTINDVIRQYGEKSQQLERTFPHRLVDAFTQSPPDPHIVEARYNEIESHRSRLEKSGLIGSEASMMQLDQASLNRLEVRRLLSLYADDVSEKLSLFNNIHRKIVLFEKLMQDYLAGKVVKISKQGIDITITKSGKRLDAASLSSGEQHIFVLFFRLIFKEFGEQHLVLIDEPELSLHPRWQLRFVDDLERIRDVSPLDFILASHSPQIYQGHKHLARDLEV